MDDLTLTPESVLSVMLYLCDDHHSDYVFQFRLIPYEEAKQHTPSLGPICTSCTYRDYCVSRPKHPVSEVVFNLLCTVSSQPGPFSRRQNMEWVLTERPNTPYGTDKVIGFLQLMVSDSLSSYPDITNVRRHLDTIQYQRECIEFDRKMSNLGPFDKKPHPPSNCHKSDNTSGNGTAAKKSKKTQSKNKAKPKKVEAAQDDCTSNKVTPHSKTSTPPCRQPKTARRHSPARLSVPPHDQVLAYYHKKIGGSIPTRPSFDNYVRPRIWTSSSSQTESSTSNASTQCSLNVSVTDLRYRRGNFRIKQLFDELPFRKKHNLEYYLRRTHRRNNKHINASSGYWTKSSPVNGYTVDLKPSYIVLTIM